MPTVPFDYPSESERRAIQATVAFLAPMHPRTQAAPDGHLLHSAGAGAVPRRRAVGQGRSCCVGGRGRVGEMVGGGVGEGRAALGVEEEKAARLGVTGAR